MTTTDIATAARAVIEHPSVRPLARLAGAKFVQTFDIETDTSPLTEDEKERWGADARRGLDPRYSWVTAVAFHLSISTIPIQSVVYDDVDEETLLWQVTDQHRDTINTVVLAGWNSAAFDVPFWRERCAVHGIDSGMDLALIPGDRPKYPPNPGLGDAVGGTWGGSELVDVYRALRWGFEAHPQAPSSLKPFAKALGLDVIEVDRTRMHDLTEQERHDYVASDARLVAEIVELVRQAHPVPTTKW